MSLSYDKLSLEAITVELTTVEGWSVSPDGALTQAFKFPSYLAGVTFANAVAHQAELLNHHPDISIGYGRVVVSMVTHDAGGGLTGYDFELARRINAKLL